MKMPNTLHLVTKTGSFPGRCLHDVQGFDYEDQKTGLKINVRDGDTEVRIQGILVNVRQLKDLLNADEIVIKH